MWVPLRSLPDLSSQEPEGGGQVPSVGVPDLSKFHVKMTHVWPKAPVERRGISMEPTACQAGFTNMSLQLFCKNMIIPTLKHWLVAHRG